MRRLVPVALVLGSLLVGVLLSEVVYRATRHFVCVGTPITPVYHPDARFGWGHKPNTEAWWWGCLGRRYEWKVYTRINSHGLRDREHAYDRSQGVSRVLLLGDSITEAMQVPVEETFADRVETGFHDAGRTVEVLNGGVAAFGTDNELEFFRAEGVRYAPDLVLLVFNVVNDVAENSQVLHARMYEQTAGNLLPKSYFHLDAEGVLTSSPLRLPPTGGGSISWWQQISSRLYFVRAISRFVEKKAPLGGRVSNVTVYGVMATDVPPEWRDAWRLTEQLVLQLRREVEATGARFAVAVMPSREAVSPGWWALVGAMFPELRATSHDPELPVRHLTSFLRQQGIPFVDLLPVLREAAARTGATGFFEFDFHLSAIGHARVAEALQPFLAERLAGASEPRVHPPTGTEGH